MVADALIYHPSISHLLRFFDTTVGRDKLMRVVQYFARFYLAYLSRTGGAKLTIDAWRVLMGQFSTARKILRVGKPLQHVKAAATAFDNKTADAVIRYAQVGRQLAYAAYLSTDALVLLNGTKVYALKNPQRIQRLYYKFWLAGIIFSVSGTVYKLVGLSKREASLAKQSEKDFAAIKKVKTDKANTTQQIVLDVLDSSIPLSGLQYISIDDGLVGIAGIVSSLIGATAQWKATA
ncbi:peroxisomal biogenesis factor 11 [Lipomyces japonicus]|uniref:peroxisomal biogenesis factor 11 n=1 Tax=Lipomyces japonicus TaxID=56871 RepID=UPI0034CF49C8